MLLAIDVGNTNTVAGLWDGARWAGVWRRATRWDDTEDEIAAWLHSVMEMAGVEANIESLAVASVVPSLSDAYDKLGSEWFECKTVFLRGGEAMGIAVRYDPPSSVGADRLANALGALAKYSPPLIVVDFGTATTLDAVATDGAYVGGAILPGISIAGQALVSHTAKLPQFEYTEPERAIGRNTVESLQSGMMLGYAGAIDSLVARFKQELGGSPRVISTGGLGELFFGLSDAIEAHEPNLTLEGIVIAYDRIMHR